jgi:hypothetical protein
MTDHKTGPRDKRLAAATLGAADWLSLAAAPTFAITALLTPVLGGTPDILCSAAHDASPLSGMVPMYLLMSALHSAPWLKLVSRINLASWKLGTADITHGENDDRLYER